MPVEIDLGISYMLQGAAIIDASLSRPEQKTGRMHSVACGLFFEVERSTLAS
ncbi:hypothetical protein PJ900_05660 [Tistrella mobilis]|uniref:hypothetical protein n=1 Tax=Tistrella mobilis TaxID=171437 RepID=UPI0012E914CD|nr:hypothetical protein [Tistrella mobilis]